MELGHSLELSQRLQLSQTQIQSLELLAMDSAELENFLQQEYLENPLLEYDKKSADMEAVDIFAETEDGHEIDRRGAHDDATTIAYGTAQGTAYETVHGAAQEYVDPDDDTGDRRRDIPAAQELSLKRFILDQLPGSVIDTGLVEYLIDCLDDNGYFPSELEDDCEDISRHTGCGKQEILEALETLRNLEPYGIFAGGLRESLLKQLEMQDMMDTLAYKIVDCHLEDVAAGRISNISRTLKVSTAQVRQALAHIAKLNPRPASGFGSANVTYITPDVILKRENDVWEIELNDKWVEDYHVSDYYVSLMRESDDPELSEYFKKKQERVRFIINSIAQRRETLTSITREIADVQEDYFLGAACLKPLTMNDIAERIGVHTSTVSRAIRGKYLQSPRGTILMKNFFSAALDSTDGEEAVGAIQAKEKIKELIRQEDKAKPYSDQALVKILADGGIKLSRRAVAKYREEMGIRGSFDRKMSGK